MGENFWADFYWLQLFQLRIFRDSGCLQGIIKQLAGGNSNIYCYIFTPILGEKKSNLTNWYVWNGLVQPPTKMTILAGVYSQHIHEMILHNFCDLIHDWSYGRNILSTPKKNRSYGYTQTPHIPHINKIIFASFSICINIFWKQIH